MPLIFYQFKITLKHTKPPLWRRIQVPLDYTFWDLHVAIQDAMGWEDCHLHEFEFPNKTISVYSKNRIGMKDNEFDGLDEQKEKISDWFIREKDKATYSYDFGDGWTHEVVFEKILSIDSSVKHPRCLAGKRICPPEDCGGIPGYEDICRGKHFAQEYFEGYQPSAEFKPEGVKFDDPQERLKSLS